MATISRKQVCALRPIAADVHCAMCGKVTRWERRPELVYRGSHRYPRWVCSSCGCTASRCATFKDELAKTRAALEAGPGSKEWKSYEALETYV